jgi:hypothetical protein
VVSSTVGLIAQLANPSLYKEGVTAKVERIIKGKRYKSREEEMLLDMDNMVSLASEAYIGQTFDANKPYRFRALFSNVYLMPSNRTQVAAASLGLSLLKESINLTIGKIILKVIQGLVLLLLVIII